MGAASGDGRVVVAVDSPPQTSSEVVQITEVVQPVAPEAAAPGRRRLSEVVTLGQGATEPVYVPGQQPAQGAGASGVVVNNNITVVNGQPGYGYGGYYGGYGYGGYGRSAGALNGARAGARDGRGGTAAGNGAWAPNGWEGAQRTAAPGHTPGVGGNWSPAPSYGPRSQR
jgi:hypothetical protein